MVGDNVSDRKRDRRHLDDAKAMRALPHPARMALCELLMIHGSLTATQAAEYLDDSPSNCSFHLRQLAKYGFVEEAQEMPGSGRSRPWQLTAVGFSTGAPGEDTALRDATGSLAGMVLERVLQRHRRWVNSPEAQTSDWSDLLGASQTVWWVTREEALTLRAEIKDVVDRHLDRLGDPLLRPPGARPIEFLALLHPLGDVTDRP